MLGVSCERVTTPRKKGDQGDKARIYSNPQKTSVRLEDYIPRRTIPDNLSPYQVLEKLGCGENGVDDDGFVKYDPSKSEDWDLSGISNCELNHQPQVSFEVNPSSMLYEYNL